MRPEVPNRTGSPAGLAGMVPVKCGSGWPPPQRKHVDPLKMDAKMFQHYTTLEWRRTEPDRTTSSSRGGGWGSPLRPGAPPPSPNNQNRGSADGIKLHHNKVPSRGGGGPLAGGRTQFC